MGVGDKCASFPLAATRVHRLNQAMAGLDCMAHQRRRTPTTGKIHHIHATGKYGVEDFPQMLAERGAVFQEKSKCKRHPRIHQRYGRLSGGRGPGHLPGGASTLSELEAAGRASILIPSPNVAENHQYHNGWCWSKTRLRSSSEEKDLSGQRLCSEVEQLANDPQRLRQLGQNLFEAGNNRRKSSASMKS